MTPTRLQTAGIRPTVRYDDSERRTRGASTTRRPLLVELLEDGDGEALRQLTHRLSESEIADGFRRYAARQLSRRSGRFWALLLDQDRPALAPEREALWPL